MTYVRSWRRKSWAWVAAAAATGTLGILLSSGATAAALSSCQTSGPTGGTYTATVCLTTPSDSATVSGPDDRHRDGDPKRDTDAPGRPASRVLPRRRVPAHRLPEHLHLDSPDRPLRRRLAHARGGIAPARRLHSARAASTSVQNGVTQPPVNTIFHADAGHGARRPGSRSSWRRSATGRRRAGETHVVNLIAVVEPEHVPLPRRRLREGLERRSSTTGIGRRHASTAASARSPTRLSATTSTRRRRRPAISTTGTTCRTTTASTPAAGTSSASTRHPVRPDRSRGRAQYEWLATRPGLQPPPCTLVYYHHPLFNVGQEG